MERYDYLVVGGGIAGTTAAETIKKEEPSARVAIVSDEPYPLYSRILLSKASFFLGQVPFDSVWMRKEEQYAAAGIDYLSGRRVVSVDSDQKRVQLDDDTELEYGRLLLAVGCGARRLDVPGLDSKTGVSYVKTLDDAKQIMAGVKQARRAVVVGAGFVGFEMCDILRQAGLEVTSVVRESYFWEPVLDEPAGRMVAEIMGKAGVEILLASELSEVLGGDAVTGVRLKDGSEIDCELLVLGVGVKFDGTWLEGSGVKVERGIVVDSRLRTGLADVWAAGDVAEITAVDGRTRMCGTWLDAQEQGRTAALNMLGGNQEYEAVNPYTAHGFGLNITFIGQLCGEGCRTWSYGDVAVGSYGGIVVHGERQVVGGFLINRGEDLAGLKTLIERGEIQPGKFDQLKDSKFDLKSLL